MKKAKVGREQAERQAGEQAEMEAKGGREQAERQAGEQAKREATHTLIGRPHTHSLVFNEGRPHTHSLVTHTLIGL